MREDHSKDNKYWYVRLAELYYYRNEMIKGYYIILLRYGNIIERMKAIKGLNKVEVIKFELEDEPSQSR